MKTDLETTTAAVFPQTVSAAITRLKERLQYGYERAYPDLRQIIHLVLDEEETKAWKISEFPHLLLPDLVEAHLDRLNLQPADTKHAEVVVPIDFDPVAISQPALA